MMDNRAVSIPINYVIMIAIVAILSSGLFMSTGGLVESQQDEAIRAGLEVAGNRLANDILAADRLAGTTDSTGSVVVTTALPSRVSGSTYQITVTPSGSRYDIVLKSANPKVAVTVPVQTTRTLNATTISGGMVIIVYEPDTGNHLEVQHG